MKYIILINFSKIPGGAEIRYISIFNQIASKRDDYILVLNRDLYNIATRYNILLDNREKIRILGKSLNSKANFKFKSGAKKTDSLKLYKIIKLWFNRISSTRRLIEYTISLKKIFNEANPTYVYSVWIGGMITWPLKHLFHFKLVYSYMDSGFSSLDPFWKDPLKCERMPLRHADIIDFLSEDLYRGVIERTTLNKKTKIAIAPCSFKNFDNIKPVEMKVYTVVFCSRLTPIKNPLLFLKAVSLFNNNYKGKILVIFQVLGEGSCMDQMLKYKKSENLENVHFVGFVSNPVEYMKKSMIFVTIQQNNNYPSQSLLEAMACENAIIASDVGETRKLVTENEGILVNLNPEEIAEAIYKLIVNKELCTQLGKNARRKVLAEHNPDKYMEYFHSLEKL